jgi:hypothetical protein
VRQAETVAARGDDLRLRAGDRERERAAQELRAHHLAGRLDAAELDERLGLAYAARTLGDLAELLEDLPELAARGVVLPDPPRLPRPRVGMPGLVRFHQVHELPSEVGEAYLEAMSRMVPAMQSFGYDVVERRRDESLVFERDETPGWAPFVAVLAFPVGLLALLVDRATRVRVDFSPRPGGRCRLVVSGEARRPVRKAFAGLADAG